MNKKCIILLVLLYLSIFTSPTFAQTKALSIGLYPPTAAITTSSGSNFSSEFILQNNTTESISLSFLVMPFQADSKLDGRPDYYPASQLTEPSRKLLDSIHIQEAIDNTIYLEGNQTKKITVVGSVPSDFDSGDFYFSIVLLSGKSSQLGSSSQTSIGIASNIFVSVNPILNEESLILDSFSTAPFYFSGPVVFDMRAHNPSAHVVRISGNISIKSIFGQEVKNIAIKPSFVLAKTKKELSSKTIGQLQWNQGLLFGIYTAEASIYSDNPQKTSKISILFVGLPIIIIGLVVVLLSMILSFYLRVKLKLSAKNHS